MSKLIKEECDFLYERIKGSEERLVELREICKHENTFEGMYSYRVGSMFKAIICSDCSKMIKMLDT